MLRSIRYVTAAISEILNTQDIARLKKKSYSVNLDTDKKGKSSSSSIGQVAARIQSDSNMSIQIHDTTRHHESLEDRDITLRSQEICSATKIIKQDGHDGNLTGWDYSFERGVAERPSTRP